MAAYATYSDYTSTYLGAAIASADFARLALRASEFLDQATFDRAASETDTAIVAKLKMATCAVAEEIQKLEASGGAIVSETIGRHSVTYQAPGTEDERLTKAAKRYLGSTGLMYRGFTDDEV
jgi:hypothetical protein